MKIISKYMESINSKIFKIELNPLSREMLMYELFEIELLNNFFDNSYELIKTVKYFKGWKNKHYEGKSVSFGIAFSNQLSNDSSPNFIDFLQYEFSACLSKGCDGFVVVNNNGNVLDYFTANCDNEFSNTERFIPIKYDKVYNSEGYSIEKIVLLTEYGDILLIKDNEIKCAYKNDKWICYSFSSFNDIISNSQTFKNIKFQYDSKSDIDILVKKLYSSCIDVAFLGTGACISIIDPCKDINKVLGDLKIEKNLLISNDYYDDLSIKQCKKKSMLKTLIKDQSFLNVNRDLLCELLSLDGATIIDHKGKFVVIGTILAINSGSDGGAREAISRHLSIKCGLSVKISADGYFQVFEYDETIYSNK